MLRINKTAKNLLICLDYDETFTTDPELWLGFIKLAKARGHHIICATMRYEHEGAEVLYHLEDYCDQIIFTGRKAKQPYLQAQGIFPAIWIDDAPHWIVSDAA